MAFAIFKLSYNAPGQTPVTGGICGSGFFIADRTALTAYHVMNKKVLSTPNPGFKHCRFWMLTEGGIAVGLPSDSINEYPKIDTTVLSFGSEIDGVEKYVLAQEDSDVNKHVVCFGFASDRGMPKMNAEWVCGELKIHNFELDSVRSDANGSIRKKLSLHVCSRDVNLEGIQGFETSFGGVEGMSGGPLICANSQKVVGLMSFGLPENEKRKEQLYAISVLELIRNI